MQSDMAYNHRTRTTTCENIYKSFIFLQAHFERMFRDFEVGAAFHYLPSFRRIRVDFASHLSASKAKQHMESTIIGENTIHCYFIQVSIVLFCMVCRTVLKNILQGLQVIVSSLTGFVTLHRPRSVFGCTSTGEAISYITSL